MYRYRGYIYDSDTGFYYLQSRYYDPEVGRFLNADDTNYIGATGTTLGYNLYAYCENTPTNCSDYSGRFAFKVVTAVVGGIMTAVSYFTVDAFCYYLSHGFSFRGYSVSKWRLAWEFSCGVAAGLIVPTYLSRKGAALIGAALNAIQGTLERMKKAAITYYTDERLPKNVGDSATMTLSDMIGLKIIVPLVDKNNKAVDVEKSYVKITKTDGVIKRN